MPEPSSQVRKGPLRCMILDPDRAFSVSCWPSPFLQLINLWATHLLPHFGLYDSQANRTNTSLLSKSRISLYLIHRDLNLYQFTATNRCAI